jgi:hypothetical protein
LQGIRRPIGEGEHDVSKKAAEVFQAAQKLFMACASGRISEGGEGVKIYS